MPGAEDELDRSAPDPDAVLRYAEHSDALVDVHLPPAPPGGGTPAPVLVLLHGGFWRQTYDRRHIRPLAAALRDLGWLVATPEYRRTGGAGGWPGTLEDIADLRHRLLALLVDALPGRVAAGVPTVVGHSAGGHLALWWALGESASRRTVALAPVADLARAYAEDLGGGAVTALLGGAPTDVPERYASADVAARLRAGESPGDAVLVHARHDDSVPVEHSRDVAADTGVPLLELDCEHMALIDPLSAVWPAVRDAIGLPPRG